MSLMTHQAYTLDTSSVLHIMLEGDSSSGKSYLMRRVIESKIPGTVGTRTGSNLRNTSSRSNDFKIEEHSEADDFFSEKRIRT